ncbi:hypothetical protein IMG5_118170 [Ichthyophthirius multifiliis]|uniref:Transmembrane protein n=1 Tax=Ichthyophthirius multifiliis TaxID=5932 RepID=G0QUK8_ICHMU|nr:hypothetical protein IMG5_118170 [Ichthyophthirius multifiliis]EGR31092.1 hypothetical protein IMG5_118170 [Ichthyophthirius multifiliis]|eukprot:XP_004034578.1 hypothetical protein IMG5_118170 [Ichthyophthirius multifiliis]
MFFQLSKRRQLFSLNILLNALFYIIFLRFQLFFQNEIFQNLDFFTFAFLMINFQIQDFFQIFSLQGIKFFLLYFFTVINFFVFLQKIRKHKLVIFYQLSFYFLQSISEYIFPLFYIIFKLLFQQRITLQLLFYDFL